MASRRSFPVANAYLEMQDRRKLYLRHVHTLKTCHHLINTREPDTAPKFITRRDRYINMQKYILQAGEENIRLISECHQKRSKSSTQPIVRKNNWMNDMNPPTSRDSYESQKYSKSTKNEKLPPLKQPRKQVNEENSNKNTDREEQNGIIENQEDNIVQNDEEEQVNEEVVDTTLGEGGQQGRLEEMVDVINGITE